MLAGVAVTDVKNVIIWGNHSSSQYPDVNHGLVKGKPIREVIQDDTYLNEEFISTVQQRGAAIIKVVTPTLLCADNRSTLVACAESGWIAGCQCLYQWHK